MGELTAIADEEKVKIIKEKVARETKAILQRLDDQYPSILRKDLAEVLPEGADEKGGMLIGGAGGAFASYALLGVLGVHGFSAVGITTGLATAGAIIGGGMVAGIGVLALPIAGFAVYGYKKAKDEKKKKLLAAIRQTVRELKSLCRPLESQAALFQEEINGLNMLIAGFETVMGKVAEREWWQ